VAAGSSTIVALTVLGVFLALRPESRVSVASSARLSTTQYRAQVGEICNRGKERGRRIEAAGPTGPALAASTDIERDEVVSIKQLPPPDELKAKHDEMIAVWERRISFLRSLYEGLDTMSDEEKLSAAQKADSMNHKLTKLFTDLGVKECTM